MFFIIIILDHCGYNRYGHFMERQRLVRVLQQGAFHLLRIARYRTRSTGRSHRFQLSRISYRSSINDPHGEFDLGVAAIVGAAIFNILVIPAAAGLITKDPLESNRDLIYKEA